MKTNKLKLFPKKWNYVALPLNGKVKEVFVDELEKQLQKTDSSLNVADFIDVIVYFDERENISKNFVVGHTNANSSHNFDLVYEKDGFYEINVMQVKTKDFTQELVFEWINTTSKK